MFPGSLQIQGLFNFYFYVRYLEGRRRHLGYISVDDRIIHEYVLVDETTIVRQNRSTWRKPYPVALCPPHNLHDWARERTRTVAVGRRRLTA
jgi:hypothetical protein